MGNPSDDTPILKSGEKFAKQAATTIELNAEKPEGQAGEATVTVMHSGQTEKVSWGIGAWWKRKFQKKGNSAGVKAKVEF